MSKNFVQENSGCKYTWAEKWVQYMSLICSLTTNIKLIKVSLLIQTLKTFLKYKGCPESNTT